MKFCCIADTHAQHNGVEIHPCDVLIHAGDFLRTSKIDELNSFIEWFSNQPAKYKLFILGNHDRSFIKNRKKFNIILPDNLIYLENSAVTLDGFKIWGVPYNTPAYMLYSHINGQESIKNTSNYSLIPNNADIIITHNPPYGIRDKVLYGGYNIGSKDLLQRIKEIKPKLHVFGHVHYERGYFKTTDTIFINAALVNDAEELIYQPLYMEINK